MGCVSSKQARCPHCQNMPDSPVAKRSLSMPVHHPPEKSGDSYHVVALTSSTLGSLKLDRRYGDIADENQKVLEERIDVREKEAEEFMKGIQESKAWSDMINEKIPKFLPRTPARMSTGDPETINAWELMEGLDDLSPMRPQKHLKSFSFNVVCDPMIDAIEHGTCGLSKNEEGRRKSVDLMVQENETSLCKTSDIRINVIQPPVELDPEIIPTLRKSFEELSPDNPFYIEPENLVKSAASSDDDKPSDQNQTDASVDYQSQNTVIPDFKCFSFGKDKVIVYFTSLRGVRKTYEDCLHVRVILKGLGLRVDERDMSMHSGFKDELKELLGDEFKGAALPRVFIGKNYIGGADEIRRLNEEGQLEKVFESCKLINDGGKCGDVTDTNKECEACGDVRFVPCESCSGSCKIYHDRDEYSYESREEDDSDQTDEDNNDYGFQRCPDCNENGLVRCPICCY